MSAYRILSVDGGGIRGLYAAVLLDRLAQAVPGFLDRVDLLAGTSTGAILILGLALGLKPSELVSLYRDNAGKIFVGSRIGKLRRVLRLVRAEYDLQPLQRLLESIFQKTTLRQLKKRVLVPAFDLDNQAKPPTVRCWKPKFFHNFPGPGSDADQLAADVALRSSAAPTYFRVYQGYVDGGVVANNPSMAALAQSLDAATGGQNLANIRLFSLGTGLSPEYIQGQDLRWGIIQWARPLVSMMAEGMMGVADYQCARLLGEHYQRLAPVLPHPVALDAADKTHELTLHAQQVPLDEAAGWLKSNF